MCPGVRRHRTQFKFGAFVLIMVKSLTHLAIFSHNGSQTAGTARAKGEGRGVCELSRLYANMREFNMKMAADRE